MNTPNTDTAPSSVHRSGPSAGSSSQIPGKILRTATRLFASEGFGAGIDRIVLESSIAKMSLYKFFPSKEKLIEGVLRQTHEATMFPLLEVAANPALSDQNKIEESFTSFCRLTHNVHVHASLVGRAVESFPTGSPIHELAIQLAFEVGVFFEQLVETAYPKIPAEKCGQQIQILLDGYRTSSLVIGEKDALSASLTLLHLALGKSK